MKLHVKTFRQGLLVLILMLLALSLVACGGGDAETEETVDEPAPAEVEMVSEVEESGWNVPAEFAEDTFPTTLSKIEEHENPWQIRDCFTCHDKETGGASEIPHDIYTQSCRQCHVPAEGSGDEY